LMQESSAERHCCVTVNPDQINCAPSRARPGILCFSLDLDLHRRGPLGNYYSNNQLIPVDRTGSRHFIVTSIHSMRSPPQTSVPDEILAGGIHRVRTETPRAGTGPALILFVSSGFLNPRMPQRKHLDRHPCHPRLRHVQSLCCCMGQIDNPSLHQLGPVGDPHHHRFVIPQVHDSHFSPKRQRRMAGRHLVHVEHLTARCLPTIELIAIPGGNSSQQFRLRLLSWRHLRSRIHHYRRRSCCCWPRHSSIRLHRPGRQRTKHPGQCHAGSPRKKPPRQRSFGVHVGCFWSFEHLLSLPARLAKTGAPGSRQRTVSSIEVNEI